MDIDDIVSRLTDHGLFNQIERINLFIEARDTITRLRSELQQARGMVEEALNGFLAIQKATIEGRVCDDVAWFSDIETLHDFCWHIADRLAVTSPDGQGDAAC